MNFLPGKPTLSILLAASFIGIGTASASTLGFTDNGNNGNDLGTSFTENAGGVTATVKAFTFSDNSSDPSGTDANSTNMRAFGDNGIGIGNGDDPEHSANNQGGRELFLIEFSETVTLNNASITEFGNDSDSNLGGDSDVEYWGGTGTFSFENLGTRFEDGILSDVLSDGQQRNVSFDNGLGSISWLLFGPESFDSSIGTLAAADYIKLRTIDFDVTAVPIPAAIWLMGSALLSLAGLNRKRGKTIS
ncbi:MAG: VPLPA-CTERM sorting domain-containing protein [Methylococcales bacterium]